MTAASEWTSLEVTKLVIGALTPLVLFALGVVVSRAARRVEAAQWTNQKLTERRLELHAAMAPKLNELYCFFTLVGDFKSVDPPGAIKRKRELDQTFHANEPLFTPEFSRYYDAFIKACFGEYSGGRGKPALLQTWAGWQEEERDGVWHQCWNKMFKHQGLGTPEERRVTKAAIDAAYRRLGEAFASEVGVTREPPGVAARLRTYAAHVRRRTTTSPSS